MWASCPSHKTSLTPSRAHSWIIVSSDVPTPTPYRFKFKARPLNPKIFQPGYQGLCGVVREEVRAPTIPVAPRLATAEREAKRKQSEQAQDQTGFVFKALDPPKGMFEAVKVPTCDALETYSTACTIAIHMHVCLILRMAFESDYLIH